MSDALAVLIGLIVPKSIVLPNGTFADASGPTPVPRRLTGALPPSERKLNDWLAVPSVEGLNVYGFAVKRFWCSELKTPLPTRLNALPLPLDAGSGKRPLMDVSASPVFWMPTNAVLLVPTRTGPRSSAVVVRIPCAVVIVPSLSE